MNVIGTVGAILQHKGAQIWIIAPEATVFEAIQQMADKNIGALLVMSGGQLQGLISERDYTRKVALKGKSSKQTPVHEIMTPAHLFATVDHTVEDCMRLMTENRIRHLPVLASGAVLGVVSIGDLVNWTISAQSSTISQLESYITGSYPG